MLNGQLRNAKCTEAGTNENKEGISMLFHTIAYQGVLDISDLIIEHVKTIKNASK